MAALDCAKCGELLTIEDREQGLCRRCMAEDAQPLSLGEAGLHPSPLLAFLLATTFAAVFYGVGVQLVLRDSPVFHLFSGHGWVPYACVFLFFCAFWMLLLKVPLIRREHAAFGLQLLPETIDAKVDATDVPRILERIRRLKRQQRSSLLVTRIRRALLRLNQLGTAEKLDDLLRYRAEADENGMESSYAAPKFIIWAIPVLGFVGTVIGISNGVQAFSSLIQNASDLDGLRESLKGVTYGLGQAFETTMIALCMSLVLMLIMSWLQRKEDRLLASIDDYCMEHLLHKVSMSTIDRSGHDLAELVGALRDLAQQWREIGKTPTDSATSRPATESGPLTKQQNNK